MLTRRRHCRAHLLAIDQGTTSTRAFLFDAALAPVGFAQLEFPQIYPAPGWVEHDPQGIWTTSVATARAAMASAGVAAEDVAGDRHHQSARDHDRLGPRDRQADPQCDRLAGPPHRTTPARRCARAGHEKLVTERTGLLLDPYFSATKIAWLLDNVPRRARGRGSRQARLRHGRYVSALALHRRQGARDRRHQCGAHAAARYPHRAVGRGAARAVPHSGLAAAGGARLAPRFRHDAAASARRAGAHPRHRGRPAGRDRSGRAASSPA